MYSIPFSYCCKRSQIAAITSHGNDAVNFVMCESSAWKRIDYNQAGFSFEMNMLSGRIYWNQVFKMSITGHDEIIESLKASCEIVFAHYVETLSRFMLHGIEIDVIAKGGFTGSKIKSLRFSDESGLFNISAECGTLEIPPFCLLSEKEFEAL